MRLRFLYATGCPACDAAKKPLAAFERAHPEVQVVREDLLTTQWREKWSPTATPTYVLENPGSHPTQWVGALSKAEIEKFISKSLQIMGAPRR